MAIKYIATFADGSTHKRASASERVYSHCWRVQYVSFDDFEYKAAGFSGSYELAAGEVAKYKRHAATEFRSEIVPAVVVPSKKREG